MKPLIGITSSYLTDSESQTLSSSYTRAIEAAGGVPVLIPAGLSPGLVDDIIARLDGLLLSGGVDVDPVFYGEMPHPKLGAVSPERDNIEIPLARAAIQVGLPVFAICRGIQVMNVAMGGTLIQDIASQVDGALKHRQEAPRWHGTHDVSVEPESRLAQLLGSTRVRVNTYHHQCIKSVASGFKVVATSPDGVIEGIERLNGFAVGVQWHPEGMWERVPVFAGLFRGLVKAAGDR